MNKAVEYGIMCQKEDEKALVKMINAFLKKEYNYRKLYHRKDDSISMFNYEYYYCQFIKEKPLWYFDLYPNADTDGKLKYEENADAQWILFVNKRNVDTNTDKENEAVDLLFEKLIKSIQFPTILLHTYKDGEERRGNIIDDE
jgi:hypothetical protein